MEKITFIIPTIGRPTLQLTLNSLIKQTNPQWKAIIIFDGIEPTIHNLDNRFTILTHKKIGRLNYAGDVRNYGITHATTDWVAFVDDDDEIKNTYVNTFYEETKYNSDIIIFRMNLNNILLPKINTNNFYKNEVGISFAVKKQIFDSGIVFEPSDYEDYEYLNKCRDNKYKILISPHHLYNVNKYNSPYSPYLLNRVYIKLI
jgi:glycosyltransferase involved in cell wall biosynthesis